MHKVFYGDHSIIFSEQKPLECVSYSLEQMRKDGITKMLEKLENYKCLWIASSSVEKAFSEFSRYFRNVSAAGGIVSNAKGDLLMINRNGKWDLPKGHVEQEEDTHICAVREVEEETGVKASAQGKLLSVTYHIYPLNGEWILKQTSWFEMVCSTDECLVPQQEEGITEVAWIPKDGIAEKASQSYASIREALTEAGKI